MDKFLMSPFKYLHQWFSYEPPKPPPKPVVVRAPVQKNISEPVQTMINQLNYPLPDSWFIDSESETKSCDTYLLSHYSGKELRFMVYFNSNGYQSVSCSEFKWMTHDEEQALSEVLLRLHYAYDFHIREIERNIERNKWKNVLITKDEQNNG